MRKQKFKEASLKNEAIVWEEVEEMFIFILLLLIMNSYGRQSINLLMNSTATTNAPPHGKIKQP